MLYYRLITFIKSRLGQVTLFSVVVAVLFVFLAGKLSDSRKDDTVTSLPKLPQDTLWQDPEQAGAAPPDDGEFIFSERNDTFRPFRPAAPKPRVKEPVVQSKPIPQVVERTQPFVPLPPMIQFEHTAKASPESDPILLHRPGKTKPSVPDIKAGTLLHCELVTPVFADQAGAPVLARLTRPFVSNSKVLLPAGSHLSGVLQRVNGSRLFLAPEWNVRLPSGTWMPIKAHTQEAAYDPKTRRYAASDGRAGLPSLVTNKSKQKRNRIWMQTLGKVATAAGKLGKDRARTALGEYVPGTARNTILEGTSNVIEHYTDRTTKKETSEPQTVLGVPAGQRFYLYLLPAQDKPDSIPNVREK